MNTLNQLHKLLRAKKRLQRKIDELEKRIDHIQFRLDEERRCMARNCPLDNQED